MFLPLRKVRNVLQPLNLRAFYEQRNTILVIRAAGGLGDILMHRMLFEDMKNIHPDFKIHFAIPIGYMDAASRHPFVDKLLDHRYVDENDYVITYKTTTACVRYESKVAPHVDKHRSDIWADHCGFTLTNHNMHLDLTESEMIKAKQRLAPLRQNHKPLVCFCPISAQVNKDLDATQANSFLKIVKDRYNVVAAHYTNLDWLSCPTVSGLKFWDWLAVLNEVDYVVSVDTGSLHAAGGLNKPLVGIFSWADGFAYTKHYSKIELVQHHRTLPHGLPCCACHAHPQCPLSTQPRKPCITDITGEEIAHALDRLVASINS